MADTKQKVDIPVPIDEVQKKTNSAIKHFHGRAKIILPFSKEKFLDGTIENIVERIVQYLPYVTRIHRQNAEDIGYLFDYYRGIQPILNNIATGGRAWKENNTTKSMVLGRMSVIKETSEELWELILAIINSLYNLFYALKL